MVLFTVNIMNHVFVCCFLRIARIARLNGNNAEERERESAGGGQVHVSAHRLDSPQAGCSGHFQWPQCRVPALVNV